MVKKGQAAMEFLMTYGWAILVVLAAIGALAYFGVLSPQNLLPERTTFQAPLPNIDTAVVGENNLEVAFRNNVGVSITIDNTSAALEFDGATCTNPQLSGTHDGAAIDDTTIISNGDVFLIRWTCDTVTGIADGDRFKADASFDYTNTQTTQTRTHRGAIEGRW